MAECRGFRLPVATVDICLGAISDIQLLRQAAIRFILLSPGRDDAVSPTVDKRVAHLQQPVKTQQGAETEVDTSGASMQAAALDRNPAAAFGVPSSWKEGTNARAPRPRTASRGRSARRSRPA